MINCRRCGCLAEEGKKKYCSLCCAIVRKEVKARCRQKNIVKVREYSRKWHEANKDYRDRWLDKNPEKKIKINKNRSSRRLLRYCTDFIYREKQIFRSMNNVARRNYADNVFTFDDWIDKKISADGVCALCNKNVGFLKLTIDHDFPLSRAKKEFLLTGKRHKYFISDVNVICGMCNRHKKARTLLEILPKIEV